jgi:hypothetical protein
MNQLTELLGRLQAGDPEARDALFAASYRELHRLAQSRLREGRCGCTSPPGTPRYASPSTHAVHADLWGQRRR